MPHRGESAKLRVRSKEPLVAVEARQTKSKFAQMTPMDVLKWGLLYKSNVPKVMTHDWPDVLLWSNNLTYV
jgi:hypothetical protein